MTTGRRSFTKEFKREAGSLVVKDGYSISEASLSMDVGITTMRRWVSQLEEEYGVILPTGLFV
ncbi:MAG: transposase [Deltaproteobacteria bacterium]|nr:transposase [Deltaproteobacteria bacterium]